MQVALEDLRNKFNVSNEQISELFIRVCGDLKAVEASLMGQKVVEWSYIEDLALTKSIESAEYQWLVD